ncbi:polymorphic toxin-type HINT domain-containing protein [Kitasatospora sp. NPDC007106]|uniref:polymorphic toxin-type HINT domain-containing protein n=1 Tax=Kitasatospora sp. NPDC007106 TaxID=3156914 RepID=UPI0033EFFB39
MKVKNAGVKAAKANTTLSAPAARQVSWPKAGTAKAALAPGKDAKAGALPVSLTAAGSTPGGVSVDVQVLGRDAAERAGISGVLMTVGAPTGPSGTSAEVAVDYSAFAQAGGAGFGARLRLVRLPACVLTTPEKPECRVQTPLKGGNDTEHQVVRAEGVPLTAPAAPTGQLRLQATGGSTVLAATVGSSGPSGDYKATPLSSASTWSTSLNSGSFTWSYDMPLTEMPGGLTPKLGLAYNSGSIDGRTVNSNNQGSWVGDGFSMDSGFVERTYKPCADDGAPKTNGADPGDLCWATDNATIAFAGHSGELIPVSADEWRIKGDDSTKIVRLRDANRGNGDNDGEYFRATTTDGTAYYFGYNRLPNWASGKPETKSVYTVPVFGNNSGEPCYNSSGFASSWCQQGWRWNLDLVVDSHGNDITYWYTPEGNNYGRNLKATDRTPYVRGGHLDHIDYGQQQGDIYSATVQPMARVEFKTAERCLEATASLCDPANINTNRQYWYDTPWDQNCDTGKDCDNGRYSPTFFTRTRLSQVVASTLRADGTLKPVDTWDLTHSWGTADFDYQLLLTSVQRTGNATTAESPSAVVVPKTTLVYKQLVNRLDKTGDGRAPFIKQRLGTVIDEVGGQIDVNYSAAACDENHLPTPQTNTTRCFPQQYQPTNDVPVTTEWFNKYLVDSVLVTDRTGGAPDMVTHYTYLGDAAWHFDDLDGITKEKLKTWSQWRGYGRVRVETGGNSGMSTQGEHFFLRGTDGDRTDATDRTKTRSVSVDDGLGNPITDDDAWAGFEYRTEKYDGPGGKVLSKTVNTPWKKTTATRVRDWGTTTANLTGTQDTRTFTSLDNGAGSVWRETRTKSTFDDYGRTTQSEGLGDTAVTTDDQCTRTTYADNTGAWILNKAIRAETVAANCGATVDRTTKGDGTSDVLADVRTRYDGQAYGAAPTKGDATLEETLKSQTGTKATYLDNATGYDVYGRILTSTSLASTTVFDTTGTPGPVTTASTNARTTTTAYTPATGRPTRSTVTTPPAKAGDATTAQTTTADHDLLRGQTVDSIDANTLRTDVVYDALGRTLKVWRPDHLKLNYPGSPSLEYAYAAASGQQAASVTTKTVNKDSSQDTSYTVYDGLGRVRQTQEPGPNNGRLITDAFYDERGQTVLTYAPYYATGAPSATLATVADTTGVETQTRNEYDGLGRVTKTTLLKGNGPGTALATTLIAYGGDRTTVTPPQGGTPTTTITDAAGRTTELRQYKASTPTGAYDTTSYSYNRAGNLTGLTDPAGTGWSWTYDQLGRRTKAVDPDAGTTTTAYNDRSEAVSTTDGRGKTVATVYDNLGRPLETHDGTATGPLLTSRTWDPAGNKGQLSTASRFTTVGGTTYEYKTAYSFFDKLYRPGRTTYTVPSVPGQEKLAGSYTLGTIYSLDGTVASISYPTAGNLTGESVAFTYDALHRPTAASGTGSIPYLSGQTYDYSGKPQQAVLSNGTANKQITVTNSYEFGTQRLQASSTTLQNNPTPVRASAYTYDQAGNVTSLTDTSSYGTDRQCFQYDYLARLTEAFTPSGTTCPTSPAGTQLGGPAPYWTSWTYNTNGTRATETRHDPAGNTGQDATTGYTYPAATAAQPHALSGTSTVVGALGTPVPETYGYDAAGNTLARHLKPAADRSSDQDLTWNTEGRLASVNDTVSVTTGGTTTKTARTTDYLYDADGNRLLAHNLDSAAPAAENWTLYLGNTELNLVKGALKAKATRYYPFGAATAVRTDDNTVTFQINDHHGTAELGIDATTNAVSQRRSTPFGGTRGTQPTGWAGTRGFLGGTNEPTGLTHLGARDYDPATGRFTSVDPLLVPADPQALAGYTYSDNNPLTFSDPSGQMLNCGGEEANCPTGGHSGGNAPGGSGDSGGGNGSGGNPWADEDAVISNLIAKFTPKSNDRDELLRWYFDFTYGQQAFNGDFWFGAHRGENGQTSYLCLGREACIQAARYLQKHDDVAGAKRIAATYCIVNDCGASQGAFDALSAKSEEFAALMSDGLGSLKGLGSAKPAAGGSFRDRIVTRLKGCNSFSPDTLVLMADGTLKPIADIRPGDEVEAADPDTGKDIGARTVTTTWLNKDTDLQDVQVQAEDGTSSSIHTTAHHPFWDETTHTWTTADRLSPGHRLATPNGTALVTAIRTVPGTASMHNLTVDELHTYYVLAGTTPVLVHNSDGPCGMLSKPGAIAKATGYSVKQIKDAIHKVKAQGGWRGIGSNKNPDMLIDPKTGEVHPQLPDGTPGESIGNIFDHLPEE